MKKTSKLIFYILFAINLSGLAFLFLGNRIFQEANFASFGLMLLFASPLLLISSIYEIIKKNYILPALGIIISLFSMLITYLLIYAIKNFM